MARPVRLARVPHRPTDAAAVGSPSPDRYRRNTAALTRAGRLFAIYLLGLLAIYGIFAAILLGAPTGSASTPGLLAGMAVVLAVGGFLLTLARTPRGIELRGEGFVLTEFLGGRRSFPDGRRVEVAVENRYPAGWLASEPTQIVRLSTPGGRPRRYLVGRGLLPASVESSNLFQ